MRENLQQNINLCFEVFFNSCNWKNLNFYWANKVCDNTEICIFTGSRLIKKLKKQQHKARKSKS